jgi:hypothetical protein
MPSSSYRVCSSSYVSSSLISGSSTYSSLLLRIHSPQSDQRLRKVLLELHRRISADCFLSFLLDLFTITDSLTTSRTIKTMDGLVPTDVTPPNTTGPRFSTSTVVGYSSSLHSLLWFYKPRVQPTSRTPTNKLCTLAS